MTNQKPEPSHLKLSDIRIKPDRMRQHFDDQALDQLAESLRTVGLIEPVVVDEHNHLMAGERRIKAARLLGWREIPAVRLVDLDNWTKEVVELEENVRRESLTYQEELAATKRLHDKYQERYGQTSSGRGHKGGWKIRDTADLLGVSVGAASQDIQLAEALQKDPELGRQKSKIAARSMMQRKQALKARQLVAVLSTHKANTTESTTTATAEATATAEPPAERIQLLHGDARQLVGQLANNSVGCLITDPPWQVEFDKQFDSDPATGLELTEQVLTSLRPKLQHGALCWLFCATKHLIKGTIWDLVRRCGYRPFEQVLVWYKPHTAHSSHPYRELKNDYEPAVLFSRSSARDLNRPMFAVQQYKLDERKLHSAQKPWRLLAKLIEVSTVQDELVLDPFVGSGQTLLACRSTGRRGIGFESIEETYNLAKGNLAYFRLEDNKDD